MRDPFLHSLSDQYRLRVLFILMEGPRNLSTLAQELQMPATTLTHHLRILEKQALVERLGGRGRTLYGLTSNVRRRKGAMYIRTDTIRISIEGDYDFKE